MKPYLHALVSVKKFGGKPEDYQAIHDFIDSSKAHVPDMRHRAILHSSFGIFICERVFGTNLKNSDGRLVSVRDVAEQHVIDDLGTIPTVQDYLSGMPFYDWLGGKKRTPSRPVDMTAPATMTLEELRKLKPSVFPPMNDEQRKEFEKAMKEMKEMEQDKPRRPRRTTPSGLID